MTKPVDNSLGFVGDYNLHSIYLKSYRYADKIDITPLFSFVEVYESLYSPFMTMNIGIIDNIGLLDKARIIGEEFLEIDIRDADNETGIRNEAFYIYKIEDRIEISDRGSSYTLKCISLAALSDMNMAISKSFKGQPSAIVSAIYDDFIVSNKPLILENTKNSIQYISNYWSPIRNIKFLCERSVARESKAPSYFFFETKREFIFTSLNALVAQPSLGTYFHTVNKKTVGEEAGRLKIIEKLYVDESFDYIKRLKTGAYGNRNLIVDPLHKIYKYGYYDFVESFVDFSRLNTEPFTSIDAPRKINSMFRSRVAPSSAYSSMDSENNQDWFAQSATEYASIDSQKISVDVPGTFNMYAGAVVEIVVYSDVMRKQDSMSDTFDSVLSGRYLVTALKHLFTKQRHSIHMELSKDSLITVGETK